MPDHLAAFARAADHLKPELTAHGLEVHAGRWLESDVLKLHKSSWLPRSASGCGIFFSAWIDADALRLARVHYNIHALKLRQFPGHAIQSRDFAAAFRAAFASSARSVGWPNLTLDHGPQTLFRGWIELAPARLQSDLVALSQRFIPVAPLIDELLARRAVSTASP
ncbi:MAG: hypothetical protein H7067_11990 [Burkholderiales bacterium]|nr:hypothetical protein [Opitutaceae bacterium]